MNLVYTEGCAKNKPSNSLRIRANLPRLPCSGVGGGYIHTHEPEQDAGCGRCCLTCTAWLRNSGGGGDSVGEVAIFRPRSLSIARFPASSTNVFEQLAFR